MRRVIKAMPGNCYTFSEVDDNELTDSFIKRNIGTSDGTSWMERTSFFAIQGIDVICDEEGKLKNLAPSLQLSNDVIAGDCVIVSLEANSKGEFAWYGLDDEKFDLVIEKLFF